MISYYIFKGYSVERLCLKRGGKARRLFIGCIVAFVLVVGRAHSRCAQEDSVFFKQIDTFDRVQWDQFKDKDTLVLFDVDNVLISAKDALARDATPVLFETFRKALQAHDPKLDDEAFSKYLALLLDGVERFVIEPQISTIICSLREAGTTVMAQTALLAKAGVTFSPEKRYTNLSRYEIEFTKHHGNTVFDTLPLNGHLHPQLYKGILFGKQKGLILRAFLEKYNVKPKRLVFFDDKIANLKMIKEVCEERNIESVLFHYVGHQKIPVDWNESRVRKQIEILVNEGKWLNDSAIDLVLQGKCAEHKRNTFYKEGRSPHTRTSDR